MKRLTFLTSFTAILFFMSIFVYVAYRASIIGLTHDECNTYTILNPAGGGGLSFQNNCQQPLTQHLADAPKHRVDW